MKSEEKKSEKSLHKKCTRLRKMQKAAGDVILRVRISQQRGKLYRNVCDDDVVK